MTDSVPTNSISRVLRKLHVPSNQSGITSGPLKVSSLYGVCGVAHVDQYSSLVSPSFLPALNSSLSLGSSDSKKIGGHWFWEAYQHALAGENLDINLCGSGVSLVEDSLEAQITLRRSQGGITPDDVLSNMTAKLETMYAVALSVSLHVSQQPLLEDGKGPHALILCATKRQCDEFANILDLFCGNLHLVVHNLFEPYPSMPHGKRADVVIGTVPLWDSISSILNSENRIGLEDILCALSKKPVAPTYASTKWRPYSYSHVSQLVLFDTSCQTCFGFHDRLIQMMIQAGGADGIPRGCQTYVINGGDRFIPRPEHLGALHDAIHRFGARGHCERAGISLRDASGNDERQRKRHRPEEVDEAPSLRTGLFIKNALSLGRLLADGPDALQDFFSSIKRDAAEFWSSFESGGEQSNKKEADWEAVAPHVQCNLAYIYTSSSSSSDDDVLTDGERLREIGAILLPRQLASDHQTRLSLLFRNLEETLTGQLFDGSVISCINFEDDLYGEEFCLVEDNNINNNNGAVGMLPHLQSPVVRLRSTPKCTEEAMQALESKRNDLLILARSQQDAALIGDDKNFQIPTITILPTLTPTSPKTILVLRRIAGSSAELCAIQEVLTSPNNDSPMASSPTPAASLALMIVEECCQYGRVLSYYCYNQAASSAEDVPDGDDDDEMEEDGVAYTASVFIEFETQESAIEAVHHFRLRYGSVTPRARVHLFRNEDYYEGVLQDLDPSTSSDCDDDPFSISYLAD